MKSCLIIFLAASLLPASNAYSNPPKGKRYVWTGASGGGWTVATNWTPNRGFAVFSDTLVFNSGGTRTVVNAGGAGEDFGCLQITNNTVVTLTGAPSYFNVNNDLSINAGSLLDAGGLTEDIIVWGNATIDGTMRVAAGKIFALYGDLCLGAGARIEGGNANSTLEIHGGDNTLSMDNATVSIAKVDIVGNYSPSAEKEPDSTATSAKSTQTGLLDYGSLLYIEGTGTFTGATIRVLYANTLQLSDNLDITGGTISIENGTFDVNGMCLTLNGTTLNISAGGNMDDSYVSEGYRAYSPDGTSQTMTEGGIIVTQGNSSIDVRGYFYPPLDISAGTTTTWSGPEIVSGTIKSGPDGTLAKSSVRPPRASSMKARAGTKVLAGGLQPFYGDISVEPGATLLVPSGKTLELGSSIFEEDGSTTIGSIQTTRGYVGRSQSFGGLGVTILSGGTLDTSYATVLRTTGTSLSVPGATVIKRYFDIAPTRNSALNASLVFIYSPGELGGASASNLHLFKSDGGSWTDKGGTVDIGSHTVTVNGINSFSRWTAASPLPAPIVTSISPASATIGSTLNLTIMGNNFGLGATSVSFSGGGITVNSETVNSSTQLTANITITPAASPTYRDILVTNSYGTGTYSNGFQVKNPAPTLTTIAPTSGAQGQTLGVTLQGSGFITGLTTASFGAGVTVSSFSVTNDHTSTAQIVIAPGAAVGTRNVSVTNSSPGGGTATLSTAFTVISPNPVPTLASISPNTGVRGQVVVVILNGSNFVNGVSSANFGGDIGLDSVTVLSDTQIRARLSISYGTATGARSVSVTNATPGGGTATLASSFTVTNPAATITSVVPGVGARGKLVNVTITGSGFIPGVTIALPVAGLTLVSATFVSTAQIVGSFYVARDAALGFRDMTITNSGPGGGSATMANAFEVQNPSPTVLSVSPNTGVLGQSLSVVVTGTDFVGGVSSVDFGSGVTVGAVTIDTSGTHLTVGITIASTATAGTRSVTVTNSGPGGGSSTLVNAFTVTNLVPTLASLSTYAAGRGQTLNVTMTGSNFAIGVTTASFGVNITVNTLTVSSPTSAIANISVAASAIIGARSVSVTNAPPGGGTATLVSVFNVGNPTPTLSTIAPAGGARGQTLDVVITGTGFVAGTTTLALGSDITVNSFTVTSFTQINASINIAFAGAVGGRDVTVTNGPPGGGSGLLAAGFTVNNPLPTLSSLSPSSANRGSIVNVTISGSQFITGVTSVNFGADIVVNSIVVKSPTEILANITLGSLAASGSRTVTVTNASPGGGSANSPAGFTVGTGTATSIEGNLGVVPDQFVLQEAYPNPFNPSTRIRYGVPEDSRVRIVIHNMLGNIVAELVNGERSKGTYELQWHADYLPSGVYLVRMNAESAESTKRYISSRKIIFMK